MGLFDYLRRKPVVPDTATPQRRIAAAVPVDSDSITVSTYDNRNITFTGDLSEYDYDSILRDKQNNIYSLFELSDYYVDKDPLFRGIIKGVYSTFSSTDWKLIGASEQVKQKYEDYYNRIHLRDRMDSIFYQYYKYANVYIYLMDDGNIITLPVHKCRISNLMVNGEPVVEFNAQSITTDIFNQGAVARKDYIKDDEIKERLLGFPPEIIEGVKNGDQWVQLNPENTFVMQDLKEDWMRYAIPIIATCLTALAKKALIENYENALLNLAINSFVHVRYGNEKADNLNMMPNQEELTAVSQVFTQAMSGLAGVPLAVTNNYAKSEVVQPKLDEIFKDDKYKVVNSEILSAGGISGIIVSGRAEDGSTFASAQVSINTADKRIELARKNFCELMNKINQRVNGTKLTRSSRGKVPEFTFVPLDLSGNEKYKKSCFELWGKGCISTKTMLDAYGFDYVQEVERKEAEVKDGTYALMNNSYNTNETESNSTGEGKVGRPEISDEERTSDKGKAQTGKQPKPSNPEGSLED